MDVTSKDIGGQKRDWDESSLFSFFDGPIKFQNGRTRPAPHRLLCSYVSEGGNWSTFLPPLKKNLVWKTKQRETNEGITQSSN